MSQDTKHLSNLRIMSSTYMQKVAVDKNESQIIASANKDFCSQAYKVIKTLTGEEPLSSQTVKSIDELVFLCGRLNHVIDNYKGESREDTFVTTNNSLLYYNLRNALATNEFTQGDKWLTADLSSKSKDIQAIAHVKPAKDPELTHDDAKINEWKEIMYENIMSVDDETADICDIITSQWIQQASSPESKIVLSADDFLRLRGIKPKQSGAVKSTENGNIEYWRGGYRQEQREHVARHIQVLDQIWVLVEQMTITVGRGNKRGRKLLRQVESKAIEVSARVRDINDRNEVENYVWLVRPGDIFANILWGPGRQTALLSQKALKYDPYRKIPEKRLARYFAWQWRNRQSNKSYMQPFTIDTLLNAIRYPIDARNPSYTKERLEKALDTLQEDNVIAHWRYELENESIIGKKGWIKEWLTWKILIEPPLTIIEQYDKIKNQRQTNTLTPPSMVSIDPSIIIDAMEIKGREKGLGRALTLAEASKEIGISLSRLSRLRRGENPSPETIEKINNWIVSK